MDATEVAFRLLDLNKSQRDAIVAYAVDEYFKILYVIASDIYDSCIQDFYAKYTPKVYDRHGNLEGWNLYQANEISYEDFYLDISIEPDQLLPYGDENDEDKREVILDSVMKGLRGAKSSKLPNWPKQWRTSYPNKFSTQSGLWSSSKKTLKGILNDFVANVMEDTDGIFWTIVSNKL